MADGLVRSSTVMAAGTAVSRVLGLVRAVALAAVIGTTVPAANAFAVGNTVPNTLYLLIAGGVLNAVLVPQVVRAMGRPDGGAEYLDRLVTAAVLVFAAATAVLVLASPLVVSAFAHSATGPQRALTVAFTAWCLPQVFFYALYTLLGQVLNARGRFGAYMWAPVVNNVVALAGLGAFALLHPEVDPLSCSVDWSSARVALLAGSSTLGVVAQAAVLFVPLRRAGVRLRPRFGVRGLGLGSAGRVAAWTVGSVAVGQLGYLAVSNVATAATSTSADGCGVQTAGFAAWNYAYLVFVLPHSLVTVSLVTALFTRMSRAAVAGEAAAVRADASSGLRTVAVATVLATAGLVVLADTAGTLVTGGSATQGRTIGPVLVALALGLVPFSASYLLQRAFYAYEDARTPFVVQAASAAVWAGGALLAGALLPPERAVTGVAVALTASQVVATALAAVLLRRRLGSLDTRRVVRTHVRLLLAGAAATAAGLAVAVPLDGWLDEGLLRAAALAVLAGAVVVVVYAAGLRLLRVEEVAPLLQRLRRRGALPRP